MDSWVPPEVEPSCYPRGYRASGLVAGIKESGRPDMALIVSDVVCRSAALFTQSRFAAPPVAVSRRHGRQGLRGVIINSGNANACTGERGRRDALLMCEATARALGARTEEILVCSTGLIGVPLPMQKIEAAIPRLVASLSPTGWEDAAAAIMTTDAFRKMAGRRWMAGRNEIRMIGIAKGAGMIQPNMATMLAFLATDAAVEADLLESVLRRAVRDTFNSISVDGETSTNDTVVLLANGRAGNSPISAGTVEAAQFEDWVRDLCGQLARMIVRDGEGATKLVALRVTGARSDEEARSAARAVANSVLFKMAVLGEDPNWGRIVAALGAAEAEVDPDRCTIAYEGIKVLDKGRLVEADRSQLLAVVKKPEYQIEIDLGTGGGGCALFWTCDISEAYMHFNAHYTT